MIRSKALSASLGVEFTGVTDPLDDAFVHRAAEALTRRGVLLVRGLHLDDEQRSAFSRTLGDDPDESRALLDRTTRERFRHAHGREVGDLAVRDYTGIPHRALPYDENAERLLHRTTVVGDEAFA
ncbi:hypothetical protein ACFY4K_21145 [Streptomyces leeuwenhoekii]|uniref:hypothetical protein n=1 Tax=Streptomyces leeuwenhoekii TaxID=1437453 RepID=UPI0036A5F173